MRRSLSGEVDRSSPGAKLTVPSVSSPTLSEAAPGFDGYWAERTAVDFLAVHV